MVRLLSFNLTEILLIYVSTHSCAVTCPPARDIPRQCDSARSRLPRWLTSRFPDLEANEEERIWLKRQSEGELDESKLTEGLTGETSIYKRRGMEKPELGAPQLKPKRIRFIFDLSASVRPFPDL